ncbi:hypothetical protein GGH14_006746, partial [Coemansia sp. RSA 370]
MCQEESAIEPNARVEEPAINNAKMSAEDKMSSEPCTSVAKDEQSYIEEITILKKRLKKYDDIFNSVRQAADA